MHIRSSLPAGPASDRQARVAALAEHVFGSADEATEWLGRKHPLLGGWRPIELAESDLGAQQVERILLNIEYGLPV